MSAPEVAAYEEDWQPDLMGNRLSVPAILTSAIAALGIVSIEQVAHALPAPKPRVELIHIENMAHVPETDIQNFEQAVIIQSRQLRRYWGTPIVKFATQGWPLQLINVNSQPDLRGNAIGYHTVENRKPLMVVGVGTRIPWQKIADHELEETLVDPYGGLILNGYVQEVCDEVRLLNEPMAVQTSEGRVAYVPMADAVTPAWFTGSKGRKDLWSRVLASANQPGGRKYGYATKVNGGRVGKINQLGYNY